MMRLPSFHQKGDPQKPPVLFPPSRGHGLACAASAVGGLAACQEVELDAGSCCARELAGQSGRAMGVAACRSPWDILTSRGSQQNET